jgi:hypothetical protein
VARYRVIQWRRIPSLVEAFDGDRVVRVPLSQRFQDLIDAVALKEGASEADAYLEGWEQGPEQERAGAPQEVAEAIARELEAGFSDLITTRFLPQRD